MSSRGGQSPPPERQTGAQQQDVPASGQGTDSAPNNKQDNMQDQLKNLTSNPKGPLEDAVQDKFTKTAKQSS
ncbi:hypothetical protein GGR54DRAFT_636427 [Hypoxylon sp. NC1633]|nr:hypothetical protein GGR54DRAFT_636427 [Hypoxylon sp. NC1633]